ncbi:MAG: hypothetical protein CMP22_07135 [Rickettsiales bacterium]|nr:hypothetical protein [Rickettsiales bacterium]
MGLETFIELNRTFVKYSQDDAQDASGDSIEHSDALGLKVIDDLSWDDLFEKRRVVILAPAGAGKTSEIRKAAIKLRSKGKSAFFLRIEHLSDNLDGAFEEGDVSEFEEWLKGNDEGWIFLDSIDEARLKSPYCFEEAVRKIATTLKPKKQSVHIIMTSRIEAWRRKTDLDLCNKQFEYILPQEKIAQIGDRTIS